MTRIRPFVRLFFAICALATAVLFARPAHAQETPRFVVFEAFMRPG